MLVKERKISDLDECNLLIEAVSAKISYHEQHHGKYSDTSWNDYHKSKLDGLEKVLRNLFDVSSSFRKEAGHGE